MNSHMVKKACSRTSLLAARRSEFQWSSRLSHVVLHMACVRLALQAHSPCKACISGHNFARWVRPLRSSLIPHVPVTVSNAWWHAGRTRLLRCPQCSSSLHSDAWQVALHTSYPSAGSGCFQDICRLCHRPVLFCAHGGHCNPCRPIGALRQPW